jgi:hypothetical protein
LNKSNNPVQDLFLKGSAFLLSIIGYFNDIFNLINKKNGTKGGPGTGKRRQKKSRIGCPGFLIIEIFNLKCVDDSQKIFSFQ